MEREELKRRYEELELATKYVLDHQGTIRRVYGERTLLAIKNCVIIGNRAMKDSIDRFNLWQEMTRKHPDIDYIPIISLEEALDPEARFRKVGQRIAA